MLGRLGVGPGQADPPLATSRAIDVHTFWPVRTPAAVPALGPGGEGGQVGAGTGLREELAPPELARAGSGATQRSRCSVGAVGDDHGQRPGPDPEVRAHEPGRGHLLVDDQLLDGVGVPSLGARPVRARPARRRRWPGAGRHPRGRRCRPSKTGASPPRTGRRPRGGRWRATGAHRPGPAVDHLVDEPSAPPSSWRVARARFRYMWASCSQVKPMPPSSWMQSLAAVDGPVGDQSAAAAVASAGLLVVPPPTARAASQASASSARPRTSMSASRCLTAWNCPMGRPNCRRTLAYSEAVSRHQRAAPASFGGGTGRRRARAPGPRSSDSELPIGPGRPPRRRPARAPTRRVGSRLSRGSTTNPRRSGVGRRRRPGTRPRRRRVPRRDRAPSPRPGRRAPGRSSPRPRGRRRPRARRISRRPCAEGQRGRVAPVDQPGQQLGPLRVGARLAPRPRTRPPWAGPARGRATGRPARAPRPARRARSPGRRRARGGGCPATPGRRTPSTSAAAPRRAASSSALGTDGGQWASSHRRTVWPRISCSSEMAIVMVEPSGQCRRRAPRRWTHRASRPPISAVIRCARPAAGA